MGLGYHIMELMKYLHKDNPLIIIEPDEEIFVSHFLYLIGQRYLIETRLVFLLEQIERHLILS